MERTPISLSLSLSLSSKLRSVPDGARPIMSQRLYTFLLFLPNSPLPRSFSLGSRYPARFVPARLRSIFSVRAGQLPVVSLYRRRNEAIRRNENGARQRPARLRGTGNPRPPTLPPPLSFCARGRHRASARRDASRRCSYHLLAEPYHSPGHHSSTLARSSATHPAGVIIPSTPRSPDLSLSLSLSFALSLSLSLSGSVTALLLARSLALFFARFRCATTFQLSRFFLFSSTATRARALSLRVATRA